MSNVKGIFPVVAMPFYSNGDVHYDDFKKVITYIENSGAEGSILFGIASEFYKLSDYEKTALAESYLDVKNNHIKIISVTDHSTELAVANAKKYVQIGADGLMLLPPFFLSPNSEDIWHHVSAVLDAVDIPVILQYAPKETNCHFSMHDMKQLGEKYPHLVYKIESPDPMKEIQALLSIYPNATILNGYAGIHMLSVLKVGGAGIIPGCSFTEIYMNIYKLFMQNEISQAQELHIKLKKYIDVWMKSVEYIIKVEKMILQHRGIITTDYCRQPYFRGEIDSKLIKEFCDEFNLYIES